MPTDNDQYESLPERLGELRDRWKTAADEADTAKVALDAAQARYDAARATRDALRQRLDDVAAALDGANGEEADGSGAGGSPPANPPDDDDTEDGDAGVGDSTHDDDAKNESSGSGPPDLSDIRPSFKELLVVIPRDGDVGMDDLRAAFDKLSDGGINSRVTKAKRDGLVESAGWGRYSLTVKGKLAKDQLGSGLRLVTSNGDD
jgi:hypothetical protein